MLVRLAALLIVPALDGIRPLTIMAGATPIPFAGIAQNNLQS